MSQREEGSKRGRRKEGRKGGRSKRVFVNSPLFINLVWETEREHSQGEIAGRWKAFQVRGDTRVRLNVQRMG